MNYRATDHRLILCAFVCLLAGAVSIQAEDSGATAARISPSPSATTSESKLGDRLDAVEQEIRTLKKSPKDRWDKLSAISGLVSGGLVALVGLFVTYVLNERNRITAEEQKNREHVLNEKNRITAEQQKNKELALLQLQTLQSFMPQIQLGGKVAETALTAIFALDKDLGLTLSSLYGTGDSVAALRKIAAGPDPAYAKRAQQSLENMITVSLKQISPDLDDLRLSASSLKTVYDLTNQVFWGLKGAVDAFTYDKTWTLKDKKTGKRFKKATTETGEPVRIDLRSLNEVGIEPGMALDAVPIDGK